MKELSLYQVTRETGEYSAPVGARIAEVRYKTMTDKATGKAKDTPKNCFASVPLLALPTTGNAGLDSIMLSVVNGYQDEMVREFSAACDNPVSFTLAAESINLDAVVKYGTDKASSLKLTESNIAAWWKEEGEAAVSASVESFSPQLEAKKRSAIVAAFGSVFAKLAAPVPDIAADVSEVMLKRIEVLGNECTPICFAIRRKLQARIEAAKQAKALAELLGSEGAV